MTDISTSSSPTPSVSGPPLPSGPRLFSAKAIGVGSFFGGPIATTLLLARNFDKLGRKRSRNQAYLLGLGVTLCYLWFIMELPTGIAERIPNAVYGAAVALIAYWLTESLQGKRLRDHFANAGQKASAWAVAGWSFLGACLTLGLMLLYLPLIPPFDFEENAYTDSLLGNEIYHSDDISRETLAALGTYLVETEYFDSEYAVSIQLLTEGDGYHLTLPCLRSEWNDAELMTVFRDYADAIEADVLGKPTALSLIDGDFGGTYRKRL